MNSGNFTGIFVAIPLLPEWGRFQSWLHESFGVAFLPGFTGFDRVSGMTRRTGRGFTVVAAVRLLAVRHVTDALQQTLRVTVVTLLVRLSPRHRQSRHHRQWRWWRRRKRTHGHQWHLATLTAICGETHLNISTENVELQRWLTSYGDPWMFADCAVETGLLSRTNFQKILAGATPK